MAETIVRAPALPNIFTVPPGRPFLDALAEAILAGSLPADGGPKLDLLDLPAMTILLPTRRATRALQDAFLRASGGRALLLPAMRPIAEGQEDLGLIESFSALAPVSADEADIPPAVDALERRLVLTRLVLAWSAAIARPGGERGKLAPAAPMPSGGATPAQAARLAAELASLMDAVATEDVSLAKLRDLVPDELSEHWQQTLEFLKIVTEYWPVHLQERGFLGPAERRNRLIRAEARRLAAAPLTAPMIVAGVTGSIPATAELMQAIAGQALGAIVLPALDQTLDDASFDGLVANAHHEHPQYGFRTLLARLGIARGDVRALAGAALPPARRLRNRIVTEALRPSGSMSEWRQFVAAADTAEMTAGLAGMSLIETPSAQDEAEAVALILREAAETPGRTAALVSPDRLLARRVAIRLESWGIRVDDSAGRPFAKTMPGAFLDLVANAWQSEFAPKDLMALLKHPMTRLGLAAGVVRRAARILEIAAFRTSYYGRGLAGVEAAVERAATELAARQRRGAAVRNLGQADWTAVRDLVLRLQAAFAPLVALGPDDVARPLAPIAAAHVAAAEAIARLADATDDEPSPLWDGEAGEAAATLFARLMDPALPAPEITAADYPDFYRTLIGSENVRSRVPVHPRLHIWGPYEARLQQTDVMVLGSLNEGTWPKAADPGAWLNRSMRKELGLPAPEEETGRAAHDLATLLGAETVYLTRANKVEGVPTVPSRWLLRLEALLTGLKLTGALAPEAPWVAWARARDRVEVQRRITPPRPTPPLDLRPRRASVSDVETWIANPYAIYARHILRLEALPLLGAEPGPSEKGQIVHAALSRFTTQFPDTLPADITAAFMVIAEDVVAELGREPRVRAFWLPRMARFAEWFAATEPARRKGVVTLLAEVDGSHVLAGPGGPFTLRARADRIDRSAAGVVITDYKTGQIPPDAAVRSGQAPQLPLEAAMAAAGAFVGLAGETVTGLRYIRATGAEPPGEEKEPKLKGQTVAEVAAEAVRGLERLIADYDDPAMGYRAMRRRHFNYDYDDYAHLARVGEWTATDDGEAA